MRLTFVQGQLVSGTPASGTWFGATLPTQPTQFTTTSSPPLAANTNSGAYYFPSPVNPGSLQTAINSAAQAPGVAGDVIVLQAGSTFSQGPSYNLPARTNGSSGTIYIISSAAPEVGGSGLPAAGTRVSTFDRSNGKLATIQITNSSTGGNVIRTANSASGYRFVGCDIEATDTNSTAGVVTYVVQMGISATAINQLPTHITFDRCYFDGSPSFGCVHTINADGEYIEVTECYFGDNTFSISTGDCQNVWGLTGDGPYKINNNRLHASGEIILFGGGNAGITNVLPSDITITNNSFYKQQWTGTITYSTASNVVTVNSTTSGSLRLDMVFIVSGSGIGGNPSNGGSPISSISGNQYTLVTAPLSSGTAVAAVARQAGKNMIEMKSAQRILVDSNYCLNPGGQGQEFANLMTVRNQNGPTTWATVSDLTVSNNIWVNNTYSCWNNLFTDNVNTSQPAQRALWRNNLWLCGPNCNSATSTTRGVQISSGGGGFPSLGGHAVWDHNTFIFTGGASAGIEFVTDAGIMSLNNFAWSNNIWDVSTKPIFNTTGGQLGNAAITSNVTQPAFINNVINQGTQTLAAGNFQPASTAAIGWTSYGSVLSAAGYQLTSSSPYHAAGVTGFNQSNTSAGTADLTDIGCNINTLPVLPGSLASDPFPRTYWQVIAPGGGSGSTYAYANPNFQSSAAKYNLICCGPYMGIEQAMANTTFATIFSTIKNQSRVNGLVNPTRCLHYTMSSEQSTVGGGGNSSTYTAWSSTVNSANWWVRTAYPAGSIVTYDTNSGLIAITSANSVTFSGQTIYQAFANHYDGVLRQGNAVSQGYAANLALVANTLVDGYQLDNVFSQPRRTADWAMNGGSINPNWPTSDASPATDAQVQQGQAAQVAALRLLNPSALIWGNCDYFVRSTTNFSYQVSLDASQRGLFDIVYCQSAIGPPNGLETANTTAKLIQNLIAAEAQMAPNGTLLFEQTGRGPAGLIWNSGSQTNWNSSDWQAARYGLAIACLRNYHFSINSQENYSPTAVAMFMDETLQQQGVWGWLGLSSSADAPQTGPRVQGVWYRNFAPTAKYPGGVVFMNPQGNGVQSLNLASLGLTGLSTLTGHYITGSSGPTYGDPAINPPTGGNPVTSITLQDRDGRFLIY
jgi:hypothetical protein